jgi:colanic acid/amylovoran biosynthesis protein
MHAAISTFQARKIAISVSYSVKYNGVIGEGLQLGNTIVDGSGMLKWNNYGVAHEVINKVEYILANELSIKDKISESMSKAEASIHNMIKEIEMMIK